MLIRMQINFYRQFCRLKALTLYRKARSPKTTMIRIEIIIFALRRVKELQELTVALVFGVLSVGAVG